MTNATHDACGTKNEGIRPLPKNWRWVRLGEICEVSTGGTPDTSHPEYYGGAVRWLKSGDVKGTRILEVPNRITELGLINSNARVHPTGSVMLAMSGQGKTRGTSAILMVPSACSQSVAALLPTTKAIPEIIHFALVQLYERIRRITGDNERTGLNLKIIRNIEIPLPPIIEQKRLATILNEQMAAVERARAAAEAQLKAAKALPAAYLRAIFNSPEAQQWPRKPLATLLMSHLKTGISKPTVTNAETQCLTLSAVRNGTLDFYASKPVEVSNHEAAGNWVKPGAYYVVRGNGNRSLVGRGALAPSTITKPVLYPDLLIEVDFDSSMVSGQFLSLVWNTQEIRTDIENRARTSAGIYKINQGNLAEIKIPAPSLHKQQEVVACLSEQMTSIYRTYKALEDQLATINALPAALLRRAFAGKL